MFCNFGVVCAADEIPTKIGKKPSLFIVNTDPSDKPGKHWTVLYFPLQGPVEFFDSLGNKPMTPFIETMIANGPQYAYNTRRLQNYNSNKCGQFCIVYAVLRINDHSMKRILDIFKIDDLNYNDMFVSMFVSAIKE